MRNDLPSGIELELLRELERDELRRLEATKPPRIRPRPATDAGNRR